MKKQIIGIMAGLFGGLGIATVVEAAPPAVAKAPAKAVAAAKPAPGKPAAGNPRGDAKDWITIKTMSFDQKLPKNWILLETKRQNFSMPLLGQWRYGSPNAHAKVFIRISQLRPGGLAEAWKRAIYHMNRKTADLQSLGIQDLPSGPNGGEQQLGFFAGVMPAFSVTNKTVHYYHHLIVRYMKQHAKHNVQVAITYLFTHKRADENAVKAFVAKHLEGFSMNDPIEIAKLVAEAAAKDPQPVKNPLPATKEAFKELQKKTEKAVDAARGKK